MSNMEKTYLEDELYQSKDAFKKRDTNDEYPGSLDFHEFIVVRCKSL